MRVPATWLLVSAFLVASGPRLAGAQAWTEGSGLTLADCVRETLRRQPNVKIAEQRVQVGRGDLDVAAGAFDVSFNASFDRLRDRTALPSSAQAPPGVDQLVADTTAYRVSLDKQFDTGLRATAALQVNRAEDNLTGLTPSTSRTLFTLTQPLLRGRGSAATGARLRASRIELEALQGDLGHSVAASVTRTAVAYWTYAAAARQLRVLADSEARARVMLKQAEDLVAADARPAAELKQHRANVAQRTAARLDSELALIRARQELGLAIGLPRPEMARLPGPTDALPTPDGVEPLTADDQAWLEAEALRHRRDLQAVRTRQRSAEVLVGAAANARLPSLDLQASGGLAGLDERSRMFGAVTGSPAGPSLGVHLVLGWPVANRAANGALTAQRGIWEQTRIQAEQLELQIGSDVFVSLNGLANSAERLAYSRDATGLYRAVIEDEKKKLTLGLSTALDVILNEDRLTQAQLDETRAQLDYATSIVELRYATGTILDSGATTLIDSTLLTVPPRRSTR